MLTCWWTDEDDVVLWLNSSAWLTFCHLSLMTESGWWTAGRSMWLLQVYSWCLLTHCRPWGDTSGQPLNWPWTQIIPTSGFPCWFTINLGHWCWGLENRLTRAYTRVEIFFFLPLFNFSGCRIDYFLDYIFFFNFSTTRNGRLSDVNIRLLWGHFL